jgi:acid phosphatase
MLDQHPSSSLSLARRLLLVLVACWTISCASTVPAPPAGAPPAAIVAAAPAAAPTLNPYRVQVPNAREVRRLLADYAKGPYPQEVASIYAEARTILAQEATQGKKNAVVLDVDETSLSNLRLYELNHFDAAEDGPCDLVVGPCSVREWFRQPLAAPIPAALAFVREAQSLGVAVIFITGRKEETREATEKNLRDAGFTGWQELVMRPNGAAHGGAADYKAPQRHRITEAGYHILLNIGDQESDLIGGYAEHTLKLPNPFYFIP